MVRQFPSHAICSAPYAVYLQPELFRFTEGMSESVLGMSLEINAVAVNDNNDLAVRASAVLVRMCGVTPPVPLVNPILDAIFDAIQGSPVSHSDCEDMTSDTQSQVMEGSTQGPSTCPRLV